MCVPTSAAMVLAFYGDPETPEHLKMLAGQSDKFSGTYYADLIRGLQKISYLWRSEGFDLDHTGFKCGLMSIEIEIANGDPVLISTSSPPIGHTMVVSGYDNNLRLVCLVDPASPDPGQTLLSFDSLEKIWHDDFQASKRWILLTSPRKN